MLMDNQIHKLIDDGVVKITPYPEENQFQPATFDVCFGAVEIFDDKTKEINQLEYCRRFSEGSRADESYEDITNSVDNFVDSLPINIRPFEEDGSFILEPGQQAIFYSLEQFVVPDWLSMHLELRSSNGRRGLSSSDGYIQDLLYEGRVRMSVVNKNPNPLKFYRGDRFAQLFFEVKDDFRYIPMDPWTRIEYYSLLNSYNPSRLRSFIQKLDSAAITPEDIPGAQLMGEEGINNLISEGLLEVSPDAVIQNNQLVFTCSDTALFFKKGLGIIDTRKPYEDEYLYDKIDLSERYYLKEDDLLVVKLEQYLKLSDQVGILLKGSQSLNDDPQHNHKVGAGWIDPGYKRQVTIHDWTFSEKLKQYLEKGKILMTGTVFLFKEPVGKAYGSSGLGSHYVNNNIAASV